MKGWTVHGHVNGVTFTICRHDGSPLTCPTADAAKDVAGLVTPLARALVRSGQRARVDFGPVYWHGDRTVGRTPGLGLTLATRDLRPWAADKKIRSPVSSRRKARPTT